MYGLTTYQEFLIGRIQNQELKGEMAAFFKHYNNLGRIKRMLSDIENSNIKDTELKESFMFAAIKDK